MNEQQYPQRDEENGSANRAVQMDQQFCFLINHQDRDSLYRLSDVEDRRIVSEPVEAFWLGAQSQRLFYQTKDHSLWTCQLDGKEKRLILGGNGDQVRYLALNQQAVFLLLSNQTGHTFLYQLSQDLQDSQVLQVTRPGQAMEWLVADDRRLYYILSGQSEKKTLVEFDLKTRKETVMAAEPGLCLLQLYKGYLVMQRSLTPWPQQDQDWEVLLMDPDNGKSKRLALGQAREMNCYWDHLFYSTWQQRQVSGVPLFEGEQTRQLWEAGAERLDLANGCLFFIDREDGSYQTIPLEQEEEDWPFAFQLTANGDKPDYFSPKPEPEPPEWPEWEEEPEPEPEQPEQTEETEETEEQARLRHWKELQEEELEQPPKLQWWKLLLQQKQKDHKKGKTENNLSKEAIQAIFKSEMDNLWKESLGRTLLYNGCKLALLLIWVWLCLPMLVNDFSGWTAVKAVGILLVEWLVLITLENRLYTPEMELLEEKYEGQGVSMAYTPWGLRGPMFVAVSLAAAALTLLLRFGPAQIKDWVIPPPEQQQQQDLPEGEQQEQQP